MSEPKRRHGSMSSAPFNHIDDGRAEKKRRRLAKLGGPGSDVRRKAVQALQSNDESIKTPHVLNILDSTEKEQSPCQTRAIQQASRSTSSSINSGRERQERAISPLAAKCGPNVPFPEEYIHRRGFRDNSKQAHSTKASLSSHENTVSPFESNCIQMHAHDSSPKNQLQLTGDSREQQEIECGEIIMLDTPPIGTNVSSMELLQVAVRNLERDLQEREGLTVTVESQRLQIEHLTEQNLTLQANIDEIKSTNLAILKRVADLKKRADSYKSHMNDVIQDHKWLYESSSAMKKKTMDLRNHVEQIDKMQEEVNKLPSLMDFSQRSKGLLKEAREKLDDRK
jgi:hypothetical protein